MFFNIKLKNKISKFTSKSKSKLAPLQKYQLYKKLSFFIASVLKNKTAIKMRECGQKVIFKHKKYRNGEIKSHLKAGVFCKKRLCPYCNFRKASKRAYYFEKNFPDIAKKRLMLYTLTFPKHTIFDIPKIRALASKSWNKFRKYESFKYFLGFIKVIEITMGMQKGKWQAHFHLHILVEVPKRYFKTSYKIHHAQLLKDWQEATGLGEKVQIVHIKKADPEKIRHLLKYELKFQDIFRKNLSMEDLRTWLLAYEKGTFRLRNIACGGTFKGAIKEPENLLDEEDGDEEEKPVKVWWTSTNFNQEKRNFKTIKIYEEGKAQALIDLIQQRKFL